MNLTNAQFGHICIFSCICDIIKSKAKMDKSILSVNIPPPANVSIPSSLEKIIQPHNAFMKLYIYEVFWYSIFIP